jgi:hypothetical protein
LRLTPRPQDSATPNLRRQKRRWDEGDGLPMALGCAGCADLGTCGGMRKRQHAFWCLDDCCGKPKTCDGMCPNNPRGFLERMREVNGLELDDIPRAAPCPAPVLPAYIPYLYHGNRRAAPPALDTVALPLRRFYKPNGQLRFTERAAIDAHFGIRPQTRIALIGSGRDKPIEDWWKLSERRIPLIAELRALGIVLITGPNYSMFTDEVRYNDMHAMKRIGTTWQEIADGGIPCAYHLNARTAHDYRRLAAFITARPEVADVGFEFRTGAAWRTRLPFHLHELAQLTARVQRPLHLVMVGGMAALPAMAAVFDRVTYIDTSAFMNAMYRQRLYPGNDGKMKKVPELTLIGQPVDGLLSDNLDTMRRRVEDGLRGWAS